MQGKTMVRGPHGVALALFALVWFSCVWFGSWELNPNNATRLFATFAIAERGEAKIDRYQSLTIDKAQFGDHYYMDKAPGMTLMAVPAVWGLEQLTGVRSSDQVIDVTNPRLASFMRLRLRVAVAIGAAVLTAFASVLLLDMATGVTGSPAAGLYAALSYALGSIVWGWSTTMLGHAPVAALLLIATWAIWRGTSTPRDLTRWRYPVMAGLALGWAVVIEFPAALGGVALGGWAIWRTREVAWGARRSILGIALCGGVAALLPLFAYNLFAFGTLFRLGYQGVVGFNGMQQGLFGLTYPKPAALFGILFGVRRGLLWVSPVILLGVFGLMRMVRARETRDIGIAAAVVIGIVLTVNASYVYWDGGASIGPRHSVPAIPFLALGLAVLWQQWERQGQRIVLVAVLAVSVAINLMIASTDVFGSEIYANPVWQRTIKTMFLPGNLSTIPNDFFGWSAWRGFFLYGDVAVPLLVLMLVWTRAAERQARAA
jgi:4-amino-4-deoxy-L-arabinose transferase-like glycosyltransferase